MKALSVKQPWASLLFRGKPVENRTYPLPKSIIGQTVAIHASKGDDPEEWQAAIDLIEDYSLDIEIPAAISIGHGAIIGTLRFVADVTEMDSPWFFGPHGFVAEDARELPEPSPCKGALGFWEVPEHIARRLTCR